MQQTLLSCFEEWVDKDSYIVEDNKKAGMHPMFSWYYVASGARTIASNDISQQRSKNFLGQV